MKIFTYIIIAVVAISIVAGFFVLGTPQAERLKKLDDTRISNLQDIQWQIINYWQTKKTLPENLDLLVNETQGTRPPVDPETQSVYEYKILDSKKLTFELCATFAAENSSMANESQPKVIYGPYGQEPAQWNWQHKIGRTCFERTIDPDMYPPNPTPKEVITR